MKAQEITIVCIGLGVILVLGVVGHRQLGRDAKDQNDELRRLLMEMENNRRIGELAFLKQSNQMLQKLADATAQVQKKTDALEEEIAELANQMPLAPGESAENRAVAAVEKMGGKIGRDDKLPGNPIISLAIDFRVLGNGSLRQIKQFKDLQSLSLANCAVTESGLAQLGELQKLQTLILSGSNVTNSGVAVVKGFKDLRRLSLDFTPVTGAGLDQVKDLKSLEDLDLRAMKGLADRGLMPIAGLKQLKVLRLSLSEVNDNSLAVLDHLTELAELSLDKTKITSAGLVHLKELKQLRVLDLSETPITDAGLAHIKGLTKLSRLLLGGTNITDAGLANLRDLKELKTLSLADTLVTDAGLSHLKNLPDLQEIAVGPRVTDAGLAQLKAKVKTR